MEKVLTSEQQEVWDYLRMPYNIVKFCPTCKHHKPHVNANCYGCFRYSGNRIKDLWVWNGINPK